MTPHFFSLPALGAALFYALAWPWTFILAIVFLPGLLLTRGWRFSAWAIRTWARHILWLLRVCCRLDHRIEGAQYCTSSAAIYAAKHQSAWDTIVFFLLLPHPVFVLKKELMGIPMVGWYLKKNGFIAVDRSGGMETLRKLLKDTRKTLDEGRSVVIFPEGTRTRPGMKAEYQPGISALYSQAQAPVVPVALNSGWFWGRRQVVKRPGTITLAFLPPMAPGMKSREFLEQLQQAIETACAKLPQ